MIITDNNININSEYINSTIVLSNSKIESRFHFPDPNSYFILSEAGKLYTIIENNTILLNPQKGYWLPQFGINEINTQITAISNILFEGSKPIEGKALEALCLAFKKSIKTAPTLKNRL